MQNLTLPTRERSTCWEAPSLPQHESHVGGERASGQTCLSRHARQYAAKDELAAVVVLMDYP